MGICEGCKRKIEAGEEFIVVGTYPTESEIRSKNYKYRVPPETYGEIYHKNCYKT